MRTPHAVIVARAAALRAAPTTTEALLWEALRAARLGMRFRRQDRVLRLPRAMVQERLAEAVALVLAALGEAAG